MPRAEPKTATERNRTEAGAALLAEIERWSCRDRQSQSALGAILFRHPGYVPLLRKRLTVTIEREAMVRDYMAAFGPGQLSCEPEIREWLHARGIYR